MTVDVGDLGHVDQGHNDLEARMQLQAERAGITLILRGPFAEGDADHIGAHNLELAAMQQLVTKYEVTADLPDAARLGDPGHTDDHNKLEAALQLVEAAPTPITYNAIVGGTVIDWQDTDGNNWRTHRFTAVGNTPYDVLSGELPFTVLVVSGGQGGPFDHPADRREYPGAPGPAKCEERTIPAGTGYLAEVGGGGSSGGQIGQDGNPGGLSRLPTFITSSGGGSVTTPIWDGTDRTFAGYGGYGNGGPSCYDCIGPGGSAGCLAIAYRVE